MAGKSAPFDLTKFDLNDPETRQWVQSNFQMDDPETQAHLEKLTAPQTQGDILVPGTGAQTFYPKPDTTPKSIIGTPLIDAPWGISAEDKKFIQGDTTPAEQFTKGDIPGAVTSMLRNAAGDVADYGAVPFQALGRGFSTIFHELGNGQSGSIGGFLEDLMNMSGGEGALQHGFSSPIGDVLSPEVRAAKNAEADALFANPKTTRADFDAWTAKNKFKPFGEDLDAILKARDEHLAGQAQQAAEQAKAEATPTPPQFTGADQAELPLQEQHNLPFERPTPEEANLKAQADEFVANKPEEPNLDFRQHELPLEKPAEQLKLNLDEPVAKPVHVDETSTPSDHVNKTVDQVNDLVGEWKDAPEFLVHEDFKDLKDVDPEAIGATMPDGKVYINASKIDSPETLSSVVYHEALGHNGMTKLFGEGLDKTLTDFYNTNDNFRTDVDKWMQENPTAYTGEGSVARAADEVLAEMSEKGKLDPSLLNKLKNHVKDFGRKMGLNLKYSDREIETILGMAHDAVVKGKGGVAENGFGLPRYMQQANDRRSMIKAATERLDRTKKGETKTTQPFPEDEPNYWRFRHVTDDGKEISGFYNVEDGKLQDFNINSKAGPGEFGPRVVRKVARDLLKEHPEAKSIGGYRISGARINGTGKSPFDAQFVESGARFMRDKNANDNRVRIGDRPSYPRHGASDDDFINYYNKSAEYYRDRAKYVRSQGEDKRADRYEHQALLEERSASRYADKNDKTNNSKLASSHRASAEYYTNKSQTAFKAGKIDIGNQYRDLADEQKTLAKKYAEKALGARFMRDRKKFLTPDKVETPRDVSDLLDYTADELEKTHTTVPDEEVRHIAEALNLSPKSYLDSQGFVDKKLAARVLAGKQIFTNMSNDIEALAEKLRAKWSPDLHAEIRQKLAVQQAIAARLDKDTAEVGRALRVQREITKARQTPKDLLRYMAQHTDDTLSTPEGMNKFLEGYEKIGANSGPEAKVGYLRDATKKGGSVITDLLNVPRTFKSSFDLSAPFRQGLFLIGKKDFWKAFPDMIKAFGSEDAKTKVIQNIQSHENYPLMLKGNLSVTRNSTDLSMREEQFMSNLAGKLPGIKHSERAYETFLNKLRADVFNDMIGQAQSGGIDFTLDAKGRFTDPKAAKTLKDISTFVNNATGRGDLGGLNGSAAALANVFFSPRLTASRINMFGYALRPSTYTTLSPVVRKEILRSYLALGGSAAALYGLAKAGGADVETNPRSSDFGKIKVGNTRYGTDLSPYITLAARLATNETKPLTGEQHELGKKYGEKDAWDLLTTFERNKLAPIPGTVVDIRTGKNVVGQEVTPGSAVKELFIPMFMSDLNDIRKDQKGDIGKAAAMSVPGLFGFSQQTFDETKKPDGTPKK